MFTPRPEFVSTDTYADELGSSVMLVGIGVLNGPPDKYHWAFHGAVPVVLVVVVAVVVAGADAPVFRTLRSQMEVSEAAEPVTYTRT
jgi:hypothetical protein